MTRRARAWVILGASALLVLGTDALYLEWRQRALEPLTARIDLTRPSTYHFKVTGLHSSSYHPELRLHLPFAPPRDWNWGENFERLWGGTPPEVEIEIVDRNGRRSLYEKSRLTPSEGWIVTGSPSESTVELYKFVEFRPVVFSSRRITLRILRGSDSAATYRPEFDIAAIKAYAPIGANSGVSGADLPVFPGQRGNGNIAIRHSAGGAGIRCSLAAFGVILLGAEPGDLCTRFWRTGALACPFVAPLSGQARAPVLQGYRLTCAEVLELP